MSNFLQSEVYKKRVAEEEALLLKEYEFKEHASWFGKTGLSEETENELAHYLRRELGESVYDEDGLKADDLEYLGIFKIAEGSTHFWKIPYGEEDVYAYAIPWEGEQYSLGWGDKIPPKNP